MASWIAYDTPMSTVVHEYGINILVLRLHYVTIWATYATPMNMVTPGLKGGCAHEGGCPSRMKTLASLSLNAAIWTAPDIS